MGYKTSSLLSLTFFLAICSLTHGALDINDMLSKYPQFSKYNEALNETKLNTQINHRKTITVLALDNGVMSSLESKSPEVREAILSVNILLDYFDEDKLKSAKDEHTQIATLFQTSGVAVYDEGFVYVGKNEQGDYAFKSGVKGSNYTAKIVNVVDTVPYTISILQVSEPVVPKGIEMTLKDRPATPPMAASPPMPDDAESPDSAESPDAESPDAESPDAESPNGSPKKKGDAADDNTSAVARHQMGLIGGIMAMVAVFFAL